MLPTPVVSNPDYNLVYEPAEDSFLFLDLFEQLHAEHHFANPSATQHSIPPWRTVVELGAGSGVISTFIATNRIVPNALFLATDINLNALTTTRNTFLHNSKDTPEGTPVQFDVVRCNLTDALRPHQVDVLLFNPPYVPSEEIPPVPSLQDDTNDAWLDLALVGGPDGMLITRKVLASLDSVLAPLGEAYILFCARNNHPKVVEVFRQQNRNFTVECVIARKCGWEELAIYRFTKLS